MSFKDTLCLIGKHEKFTCKKLENEITLTFSTQQSNELTHVVE